MKVYQLAVPRENEYTPEAAASLFGSMAHLQSQWWLSSLLFNTQPGRLVLETVVINQKVYFFAAVEDVSGQYFESQFQAAYPLAVVSEQEDYLQGWRELPLFTGQMVYSVPYYFPLKTYSEFKDTDPMVLILGVMSKAREDEVMLFQLILAGAGESWRNRANAYAMNGIKQSDGTIKEVPGKALILPKIAQNGFWTAMRVVSNRVDNLSALASAFGSLGRGDGNSLKLSRPWIWQKARFKEAIFRRSMAGTPSSQVLTVPELATIWHMPNLNVKVHNLTWAKNLETEAPDNLPVFNYLSEEERENVNFFGKTNFRGEDKVFGIKREDRMRHMYVIGKSGVGKSTLLENLAIGDMKKGEGLAFLDPHGSSVEALLNYVPKHRINDVVYFDPGDVDNPIPLNILEVVEPAQREFVASGILSIFAKLYGHSWGPRLEYILRNTLLTLTEVPGTTLPNVIDMLTNADYRKRIYPKLTDPVMLNFWHDEFDRWERKQQAEYSDSILNKVGQFVSSPLIRKIISEKKSNIDFEQIMNEGKILLVNLSQGRMGEDNSALLGAMVVTKIQLAAMRRARYSKDKWKDFYLYVDEFQNFATTSFIKILSEARKYRLGLTLANQYVEQIDEAVMAAILGNAGSLVNFLVGATDADKLEKEFGGAFMRDDLTHLGRGEVVVKLAIDGLTSRPFFAKTLPPAMSKNQNKEKVLKVSRERWGKRVDKPAEVIKAAAPISADVVEAPPKLKVETVDPQ